MQVSLHILIIADNSYDAETLCALLLKSFRRVNFSFAADKIQFLNEIGRAKPDVILAENVLPQFGAAEALLLLHSRSLRIPFILFTGTVSEAFAAGIIRLGADDYILKERPDRLPAAIESAIHRVKFENEKLEAIARLLRRNQELLELFSHLENLREEERIMFARQIHDELGQNLTGLKMDLQWLNKNLPKEVLGLSEKVIGAISLIDRTVKAVRRIASELRPSMLDDLGLVPAMEWHVQQLVKHHSVKIEFIYTSAEARLPSRISTGIFRIYQEIMANIISHSNASIAHIVLRQADNKYELTVSDDGVGFEIAPVSRQKTLGMLNIRERTETLGGTCESTSVIGIGTIVTISIPEIQE